jgi:hypothetical protein
MIKKSFICIFTFFLLFLTESPIWAKSQFVYNMPHYSVDNSVFSTKDLPYFYIENLDTSIISPSLTYTNYGFSIKQDLDPAPFILGSLFFLFLIPTFILFVANIWDSYDATFKAKIEGNNNEISILWIYSILVPGFGQIIMGDIGRGIKFLLLVSAAILSISLPIIYKNLGVLFIILVAGYCIYFWNISDAYSMAKELAGFNKLNSNNLKNLEEQMMTAIQFSKKIKISNNGTISLEFLTF